jgi:hypothetical protein
MRLIWTPSGNSTCSIADCDYKSLWEGKCYAHILGKQPKFSFERFKELNELAARKDELLWTSLGERITLEEGEMILRRIQEGNSDCP